MINIRDEKQEEVKEKLREGGGGGGMRGEVEIM